MLVKNPSPNGACCPSEHAGDGLHGEISPGRAGWLVARGDTGTGVGARRWKGGDERMGNTETAQRQEDGDRTETGGQHRQGCSAVPDWGAGLMAAPSETQVHWCHTQQLWCLQDGEGSTQDRQQDTGQTPGHTQSTAGPAGYFSMVVAPETAETREPRVLFSTARHSSFTCGQGPGDCEPRRLVGLANIIGNLTNILPALGLCHIIQGQHLRIRAINPRVLEQTNNMESQGRLCQEPRCPEGWHRSASAGAAPPTPRVGARAGAAHRSHRRKEQAGMGV